MSKKNSIHVSEAGTWIRVHSEMLNEYINKAFQEKTFHLSTPTGYKDFKEMIDEHERYIILKSRQNGRTWVNSMFAHAVEAARQRLDHDIEIVFGGSAK